jgi:1-pyrroline-5-carboxylate dehydrogenase
MSTSPVAMNGSPDALAPKNEELLEYEVGSTERSQLCECLAELAAQRTEMPLVIDGCDVRSGRLEPAVMPHAHSHSLGDAHCAGLSEISAAIAAATRAAADWSRTPWIQRAAIFHKAAELLSGPWRARLNAATMLGQSKTAHQAEIDSAAELIDFWRFNVHFMRQIYEEQPRWSAGGCNFVDYRPLEGFVLALTPFNFTAIAANLSTAPAIMGNSVIWKPAATAKLSAYYTMELLREAGLPDGVINLVYGDGAEVADVALQSPELAGVHFTGSTPVFRRLIEVAGRNIVLFRNYPRLVGETGGKNFILAHPSADVAALTTAIVRGAFEYQGQKCSAASRLFVPRSLWPELRERLCADIETIRVGDVADFGNFMGAVIDERAWQRHSNLFQAAQSMPDTELLIGGKATREVGYFVSPTIFVTADPSSRLLSEEFFGPIATVFLFDDARFDEVIELIDRSTIYGLTGSVFATDRAAIQAALSGLRNAAGNFYINDKPTGAVVGQQPFGGARGSGTNDKAGSIWNLIRWTSPRTVKETFCPPRDYRYRFMAQADGSC